MIYTVVVALLYALMRNSGIPKLVPGDIYIQKAGRKIYIPIGASFIATSLIFAFLFKYIK